MLSEKGLLIFDGGMGSEFERMGLGGDPVELNVTHPEQVRAVHRAYVQAGADVITANSFGLNRIKYRGEYPLERLVRAAVENGDNRKPYANILTKYREKRRVQSLRQTAWMCSSINWI